MNMIINSKNELNTLEAFPFYELQNVCEVMLNKALEDDTYRKIYEEKYEGKITKFSCAIEFCLHELGLVISDPLNLEKNEVMFSNGKRSYIASKELIEKSDFNRHNIKEENIGFPILTDDAIKLDRTLDDTSEITNGLIDEDSYMNPLVIGSKEEFARIYLMHRMASNEELYNEYKNHIREYKSVLEFLIKKLGLAYVNTDEMGKKKFIYLPGINKNTTDIINHLQSINPETLEGRRHI